MRTLMMPDYRADNPYQALLANALQMQGVEVYFPQGYRRILPIRRALKDHTPIEILHLHWLNPYLKGRTWLVRFTYSIKFLVDIWLCKQQGYKIVWTIHNRLSHEAPFPTLELWTIRQFVKLVDRIIVHHQSTLPELAKLYQFNLDKAAVVPHGHYCGVYGEAIEPAEARAILGLPESGKLYLNFGMLRPYKGIEHLLKIWRDYPEVTADHILLIVGKPLNEDYGQQLIEQAKRTKGAILHLGFVENHLISGYFSAADIVVLPFENILTSGSLLLAMSYAKPIIVPQSPGTVETLGSATDLVYDSKDKLGLLQAIQKGTRSDLAVLSEQVKQACSRSNWQTVGHKTQQVYQLAAVDR